MTESKNHKNIGRDFNELLKEIDYECASRIGGSFLAIGYKIERDLIKHRITHKQFAEKVKVPEQLILDICFDPDSLKFTDIDKLKKVFKYFECDINVEIDLSSMSGASTTTMTDEEFEEWDIKCRKKIHEENKTLLGTTISIKNLVLEIVGFEKEEMYDESYLYVGLIVESVDIPAVYIKADSFTDLIKQLHLMAYRDSHMKYSDIKIKFPKKGEM